MTWKRALRKGILAKSLGIGLLGILLVFAFQNCGKAGFDDEGVLDDLSSSDVDPKLENLPFPYEANFNQLVYMSCPNPQLVSSAPEALFTFHVGAYDNTGTVAAGKPLSAAGVSLRSDYKTAFDQAMSFYNSNLHTAKLKEALMSVPNAIGFQPQVAFRDAVTPRKKMTRWLNFDAESTSALLVEPLSRESYADLFALNPNKKFNFFHTAPSLNKAAVSAYIKLPAPVQIQDEYIYRSMFSSNYLALSFVDPNKQNSEQGGNGPLAASVGADNSFYGRAYQITFESPFGGGANEAYTNHSLYPARTIDTITEYDANNPNIPTGARWSCDYKFKVVKPEDRARGVWRRGSDGQNYYYTCDPRDTTAQARASNWYCACPPESYEELTSNEHRAVYHMLRRSLPAEVWDINVSKRCVVPKASYNLCYQSIPQNVPISYDEIFFTEAERVEQNPAQPESGECDTPGQPTCAHYVTLCYREQ